MIDRLQTTEDGALDLLVRDAYGDATGCERQRTALRVPTMPSALVAATLITMKECCPVRRSRQHRIAAGN